MREIILSDNTAVRIINRTGLIEKALNTKRVEIQLIDRPTWCIDKSIIIYTRDLDKICDTVKELFEED